MKQMYASDLTQALSSNAITDLFNKGKDTLNKAGNDLNTATDTATAQVEEIIQVSETPVSNGETEGIVTKVKRKFNDTSPTIVGAGGFLVAKFVAKLGTITSLLIGGASYLGKQQLDKSGGLSDEFNSNNMLYQRKSTDGKLLYMNTDNGRLYYSSGTNSQGVPIWNQYN